MSRGTESDDGIYRNKIADGEYCPPNARNAALIGSKMLQHTTLSVKLRLYTMTKLQTYFLYIMKQPCLSLNTLRGPEATLQFGFLRKI